MSKRLAREEIVEQWSSLIGGGHGKDERVFTETEALIAATQVPDAKLEHRAVSPGLLRGMLGGKRPFLIVSNTSNANLKSYKMYINARDYGTNLQVSWYLVHQPSDWEKAMASFSGIPFLGILLIPLDFLGRLGHAGKAGLLGLDVFDAQDLRAYVTNAHHCLLEAVDRVVTELGQDPSMIDRKSSGFLGIS